MRLPGGVAPVLAMLDQGPADPDTAALTIIRLLYAIPPDATEDTRARWRRLSRYLAAVDALDQQVAALAPSGVSLAMASGAGADRRRLQGLARASGLELQRTGSRDHVVPSAKSDAADIRRALAAAGFDAEALASRLNAGEVVRPVLSSDTLPLPLPAGAWQATLAGGARDRAHLAAAILRSRDASFLYYGAYALDDRTRAAFAAAPQLLASLTGERAARFAVFGRSIHIREGRIDPPGGPEAVALWEALAGAPTGAVREFVRSLLQRDRGALAYFYDAVAHLDRAHQRYTLGLWMADPASRLERFTALYRVFVQFGACNESGTRPFSRRLFDPAIALMLLPAGNDGEPPGGAWRRLWANAFTERGLPADPRTLLKAVSDPAPVDAAWLLEQVMVESVSGSRDRMDAILFSWRTFARAPEAAAPDILVALRGCAVFPTLILTLERAGISDPHLYAAAARTADSLTFRLTGRSAQLGLVQFQAAIALVARARFRRTMDEATAGQLLADLVALPLDEEGRYGGQICRWLATRFIPATSGDVAPASPGDAAAPPAAGAEHALLRALAGRDEGAEAPVFEWGGEMLRVDLAGGELDRLERVRARQGTNSLDAVLAFWQAADAVSSGVTSVEAVAPLAGALQRAAADLRPIPASTLVGPAEDLERAVREACDGLAGIGRPSDLDKAPRIARPLLLASDALVADTFAAIVYAANSGDTDSRVTLAGNPARFHDLALTDTGAVPGPWRMPQDAAEPGQPWHVQYSLLALDVALARHTLPRLFDAPPPHAPTMTAADGRGFARAVVLMNPFDLTDRARDEVAAALARGRARVARLAEDGRAGADHEDWAAIAGEAGIDEWRRQAASIALATRPERAASLLALAELVRIGRPDPSVPLDPWGAEGVALQGCLCLKEPLAAGWEFMAGRASAGLLAAHLSDLALQVAAHLADLHVPARLGRLVLAHVTGEFLQNVALAHDDDWMAAVEQARQLPRARVEEVLNVLSTSHFLVPVPEKEH